MKRLFSFLAITALMAGAADANTAGRDPRAQQNYSAGKGVGAASVSVSFGDGTGINLVTEAPVLHQQMVEAEEAAEHARMTAPLPVRVGNRDIEMLIRKGEYGEAGADLEDLAMCASVNPGATFAWDRPTFVASGIEREKDTCVMEVELMTMEGTRQIVVAKMTVPVGVSFDCNIDSFPAEGYQPAIEKVILPADREPTEADVEKQMDEERKQNSVMKAVAGGLVGGVVGNMFGNPGAGNDSLFGFGGNKIGTTVAGAAIGAGGMYAAQNVGHVAGSAVESALIGGAGGMVIGNMTAGVVGGNARVDVKRCLIDKVEKDCLRGYVPIGGDKKEDIFCSVDNPRSECFSAPTAGTSGERVTVSSVQCNDFNSEKNNCIVNGVYDANKCAADPEPRYAKVENRMNKVDGSNAAAKFVKGSCTTGGRNVQAVADWTGKGSMTLEEFNTKHRTGTCHFADANGNTIIIANKDGKQEECKMDNFNPNVIDASDGGVIDFNNSARNTGTLIGAGAGAGVGGLAGYKGATGALTDRYFAAVKEYTDSLKKFNCQSGPRFLGYYRDQIVVPMPIKP